MRFFHVAALTNRVADVQARQIPNGKRAHRHSKPNHRRVDLLRRSAFVHQEHRLAQILLEHAVADKTVTHAGHDADLFQPLCKLHHGRKHIVARLPAAHDLEQSHYVGRAEKVCANDVLRPSGRGGNLVNIERGSIGCQNRTALAHRVETLEHVLLDGHVFVGGFDHDVGRAQAR